MNLKSIIAISGMNGLFKLISKTKNNVIVENVTTKKRQPAFAVNAISALEEITVYTEGGTVLLKEIFKKIEEKEKGNKAGINISDKKTLSEYFHEILPEYDKEKVHSSHIKKIISWYNILQESGLLTAAEETPVPTESKPEEIDVPAADKSEPDPITSNDENK
ncbi:MAG: DUF5606 domain-containing protein [Bacteroidetes bacterium]|nr:DUF5606 domain-containing protein [Bacteroidota bacterium]